MGARTDGLQPRRYWQSLTTFPKRKPFHFAVMLNSVLCLGADANTQWLESRRIDYSRLATFFCFGIWQGASCYYAYLHIFPRFAPRATLFSNQSWREKLRDRAGQIDILKQCAIDNFVWTPLWYFPSFYTFKAFIMGGSGERLADCSSAGLNMYQRSFVEDNIYSCALWVPADFVVFTVPSWMRMPVCSSINLGWTMLLSWLRGSRANHSCEADRLENPTPMLKERVLKLIREVHITCGDFPFGFQSWSLSFA